MNILTIVIVAKKVKIMLIVIVIVIAIAIVIVIATIIVIVIMREKALTFHTCHSRAAKGFLSGRLKAPGIPPRL